MYSQLEKTIVEKTQIYYGWNVGLNNPRYALKLSLSDGYECCAECSYEWAVNFSRSSVGAKAKNPSELLALEFYDMDMFRGDFVNPSLLFQQFAAFDTDVEPSEHRLFTINSMDQWFKDDVRHAVLRWPSFVQHEVKPAERAGMAIPSVANVCRYLEVKGRMRPYLEHELHAFIEDVLAGEVPPFNLDEAIYTTSFPITTQLFHELQVHCCKNGITQERLMVDVLKMALSSKPQAAS